MITIKRRIFDEYDWYQRGNEETQQFEQSDHLDPQPAASVLANKSPSVMSRSDSRTSLNNLNKEEGSVLKLAKLRDFHSPNSPYRNQQVRNCETN